MAIDPRARIESGFEAWSRIVSAHPVPILLASLALAASCSAGLSRVWVDVTFESFLRESDPVLVAYDAFRDQFGRDERIVVSVEPGVESDLESVFDLRFLARLRALHEAFETRVPYLDEVTSLVNARDTRGEGDTLRVADFLEPWPETEVEVERLRQRALANPLFLNNLLSTDGRITTLSLEIQLYSAKGAETDELGGFEEPSPDGEAPPPFLTGEETAELVDAFHEVVDEFQDATFTIHFGGSTVMLQDIAAAMFQDMPRFVALAFFSIATFLFVLFRRVTAVAIPLLVVGLSVASTIGLMGWAGVPLHVPTQILPSFLLAVGIGDAVHLLSIFFAQLRSGTERDQALAFALGHSGLALVLTSLTTAAGLASFATAGLAPVAAIGVFAPAGVLIALVLSLTMLPALVSLVPFASSDQASTHEPQRIDRLLMACGAFATRRPGTVLITSAILAALAFVGAARLELSHDPLGWLDERVEVVRGMRHIDRALGGSVSFEVLLETEEVGGIRQPEALRALARLGESFESEPRDGHVAGQTISLADVVKEIHRALNEDRAAAYVVPDDPRLVRQELLLFENTGADELEDVTDAEYRLARMTVRMPWHDAVRYEGFFDQAEIDVEAALGDFGTASISGVLALLVRAIGAVVTSMATSYVLAFGIITPLLVLLLGNLRAGLIAMIPNTMPILLTLGLMGLFDLPLDAFSLLIGGIALGLAVDDTIHFMHNYRRYRRQGQDLETAVATTLRTTGRAMLITTVVLSTGFLGFVLSSMHNLANMGVLVSFAIGTALAADVLLAPALLAVFDADPQAP